jgi:hypothetical protein
MGTWTYAVGSLDALRVLLRDGPLELSSGDDVVVIPTAAAFIGVTEVTLRTSSVFDDFDVRVEALMVTERATSFDNYYPTRVLNADVVVLCDGSALHARSVWRANDFGDAIKMASTLVAVGEVASAICEVMIDPRGGAPASGLGFRKGAALCVPSSDEQMFRTRSLLHDVDLVAIGPTGIVGHDGDQWRVLAGDVTVTRGHDVVEL